RSALRNALYAAITIAILTLTGIFGSFSRRFVLEDQLSLSTVLLIGTLVGTGYLVGHRVRNRFLDPVTGTGTLDGRAASTVIANSMAGGMLVAAVLSVIVALTTAIDMRFVFQNLGALLGSPLVLGQTELLPAILTLLVVGIISGAVGGLLVFVPQRVREVVIISLLLTVVLGILQGQINNIITLADALAVTAAFSAAALAAHLLQPVQTLRRVLIGAVVGAAVGIILGLLAPSGLEPGGWMRIGNRVPQILGLAAN